MTTYTPHLWAILKITGPESPEPLYKVFATWRGGYLDSPAWKLNSGNVSVEDRVVAYSVLGYSGSNYLCYKGCYGMSAYSSGVLNNIIDNHNSEGLIKLLSEEESLEYLEGMCE